MTKPSALLALLLLVLAGCVAPQPYPTNVLETSLQTRRSRDIFVGPLMPLEAIERAQWRVVSTPEEDRVRVAWSAQRGGGEPLAKVNGQPAQVYEAPTARGSVQYVVVLPPEIWLEGTLQLELVDAHGPIVFEVPDWYLEGLMDIWGADHWITNSRLFPEATRLPEQRAAQAQARRQKWEAQQRELDERERTRREAYVAQHPELDEQERGAILAGRVLFGMSMEAVEAAWGPPTRKNRTVTARSTQMQYVYKTGGGTVYFYWENGRMTRFED